MACNDTDVPAARLRRKVRVKAPIRLLLGSELETFLERGYAPEICFESWDLDRFFLGGGSPEDLRPLARALNERGLRPTFHGPFLGLDPGSPHQGQRDEARKYMEYTVRLAEVLGPQRAVFHGGGLSAERRGERERWAEASVENWAWLARALGDLGCTLVLENVVDYEPEPLALLLDMVVERGPEAGWCFDVGHQRVFDRVGLEHWIEVLGPRLMHLHLHDNLGKNDDHLPLGQGSIDLPQVMSLLAPLPEPTATLEIEHRKGVEQSLPVLATLWPWPGGPDSRD